MNSAGKTARDRRLIAGLVRRAVSAEAPLLAKDLERYATAEGFSWEELARSLGGTADDLNRVALCRPPRPERFAEDTRTIAAGCVDPDRLLALLRQLQVLSAFTGFPRAAGGVAAAASHGMLLAARDVEEGAADESVPAAEEEPPGEAGQGAGEGEERDE